MAQQYKYHIPGHCISRCLLFICILPQIEDRTMDNLQNCDSYKPMDDYQLNVSKKGKVPSKKKNWRKQGNLCRLYKILKWLVTGIKKNYKTYLRETATGNAIFVFMSSLQRSRVAGRWIILFAFKRKSSRNSRHTVIFGIQLQSWFWNTLYYQWKSN
jgi:hypothetical protein